jgi:hypothetical protein
MKSSRYIESSFLSFVKVFGVVGGISAIAIAVGLLLGGKQPVTVCVQTHQEGNVIYSTCHTEWRK